ncbi:daunorubicin resistance protein DrrA family ABC transporter ATP-binding protein [Flexivirga endophytica]|uniref:Daunorubicin resistance protein DrrA family ABC transporter ATP-binding protein n=1 Tax=Flexivirga endophytica TaxID=1849103 RepID=A0A916TL85_9MICO|nr:ATP-binding cassette domain-containing protein [Flexivirga endophytica]GGB46852.1 daunorubicin resistance protein DrrA family ABC transporter ATP-binding protein [Flexivirga endophytica]GHB67689.1 daunorubicin resistance protein DrrA family ABC transporter ATP-binding protein [Flexivirga endophytica]
MTDAVTAEGLVKHYKDVKAVDGVSLRVPEGSVLGVLGPNGAGKTTTVRMLTTLIRPDAGTATVAGADVLRDPQAVRRQIGVSGQYAAVDEYLTGRENLEMIGRLYHLSGKEAKSRAAELLGQFRLEDAAGRPAKTYSGGMRRRLDLAGALVARPPVIFLDEPTTGLDPRGRGDMWDVINNLVGHGTSVLLTTQYLEEADRLADNIVVIDHGQIIAEGTADELKAQVGGERLEVTVADAARLSEAAEIMRTVGAGATETDEHTRRLIVPVSGGTQSLLQAVRAFDDQSITVQDIGIRRPTLDDAFLSLTGHKAETDTELELVGESA